MFGSSALVSDEAVSSTPCVSKPKQSKVIKAKSDVPNSNGMVNPGRPMAPCRASRGEATLHNSFPAQSGVCDLKVIVQPENQHRARYQTEGSRGAIKDQSQSSFPKVKVCAVWRLLVFM